MLLRLNNTFNALCYALQDVSPGFVLCAPDNLCHTVKTFEAQVQLTFLLLTSL